MLLLRGGKAALAAFFAAFCACAILELACETLFAPKGLGAGLEGTGSAGHALRQPGACGVVTRLAVHTRARPTSVLVAPARTKNARRAVGLVNESAKWAVCTNRQSTHRRELAHDTWIACGVTFAGLYLTHIARRALGLAGAGEVAWWAVRAFGQTTHARELPWLAAVALQPIICGRFLVLAWPAVCADSGSGRIRDFSAWTFHAGYHALLIRCWLSVSLCVSCRLRVDQVIIIP